MVFQVKLNGVSSKLKCASSSFKEISRVLKEIEKECQGSFNDVSSRKKVSRMFQEFFKKVLRVFQGSFNGIKGRLQGVSRNFLVGSNGI